MWIEGRLVETGRAVRLELDGPQVSRVLPVDAEAHHRWIAPGFIDLQVNGYAGFDVNGEDTSPTTIKRMVESLWRRGVTTVYPTVVTQSAEQICQRLEAIRASRAADPLVEHSIAGIHIEGPSISVEDGPRGAHALEHVRPPSLDEYRRWQAVSDGKVGIITLAPEHPGTLEYVRAVAADGVVVALGHTAATEDQIQAAVDAGACLATHLGNGAHAQLTRHPNYIWEQLAEDRLMASLIFDGHHLPPSVMKSMLRAKGLERVILVSDAVATAGLPPGIYSSSIGGTVELLPSGSLNLMGTPYLAGSVSSLAEAVANAVRHTGLTLADAVRLVTANPARLLRLDGAAGRGSVRAGSMADLTLFQVDHASGELEIETTIVRGQVVYRRGK